MENKEVFSDIIEQVKNVIISYIKENDYSNILYLHPEYEVTLKTDSDFTIWFTSFPFCKKQINNIRAVGKFQKDPLELDYYLVENGIEFGTVSHEKTKIIFKRLGTKEKNSVFFISCSKKENEQELEDLLKHFLQELKTLRPIEDIDKTLEEEIGLEVSKKEKTQSPEDMTELIVSNQSNIPTRNFKKGMPGRMTGNTRIKRLN